MRRNEYTHRRRHISNRHLSDKYYYAGEHETATGIRLTQYNEQSLHTKEVRITDTSFSKLTDSNQINWFEVSGLTNADAITRIVKDFGLHNLDAKDILTPQHVVKVEEYKGRMLIVLNSCYYDVNNEMRSEHISILVANNTVITFTESKNPSIRIRPSTGRPTAVSTSVRGSPQKFICTTRRSTRAISYGGPTRTIPRRRLTSSSVRVAIIPIVSLLRARTGSTSRIRIFQSSTTRHSSMSTMPAKRFSQPIPTAAYIDTH